jgi:AraC-like DNA-binding protein
VDEVARRFGVTSWTLRRRLTDEATSYSMIRKRVQLSMATEFLRRSDLTINEVAELANFSDAGAFRRAFQQWTGHSPSAYREDVLDA